MVLAAAGLIRRNATLVDSPSFGLIQVNERAEDFCLNAALRPIATKMVIDVIDDDPIARSAMALSLNSLGWNTRTFDSAEAFLRHLPMGEPDCLITDLHMPGINGAELNEALAARECRVPVLVVTSNPACPLAERALAAGARAVLEKPQHFERLASAVSDALTPRA